LSFFLEPLFLVLLGCSRDEVIRQLQYALVENRILRSKLPKRIELTPEERNRLLKFGRPVGPAIQHLVTIVHPKTFARWKREADGHVPSRRVGRPRTKEAIVKLLVRFARQTDWGYSKMQGELKKLGFGKVGRTTIQNTLKREGCDPGPGRGPTLWDDFIERHAKTLWAADFLSVKAWTSQGLRQMHLLAFIHIETRQVWVSHCTLHPTQDWVAQQARNFLMHLESTGLPAKKLLMDRDGKFAPIFDAILKPSGIKVKKLPVRSPNLNAFAERFIQTLKHECLNHFVILGHKHLNYLVATFVDYYHTQRPHQGKDNEPLLKLANAPHPDSSSEVLCEERLGGLIKHYYRKAA